MANDADKPDPGTDAGVTVAGVDAGVPANLQYIGIIVGVAMLAGGFFAMIFNDRLYGVGVLLVCVGFGITLAVFGSRASGVFLNFNLVGGGAMAVALYLLLFNFPITPFESYVRGKIERTDKLVNVVGTARKSFFVGRPGPNADFEFVIFEQDSDSSQFYFFFQFPEGHQTRELYIGCIDSSIIRGAMGGSDQLVLTLEDIGTEGEYQLVDNQTGQPVGTLNKKRCAVTGDTPVSAGEVGLLQWPSISAHAQSGEAAALEQALPLLESEDASQRDFGRTLLASLNEPESYKAIARSWNIQKSSYRADLGRLVGWSSAIERDRRIAVFIAESLSPEQFGYLVQLTGQGDITMRQFATEVLHRLLETTSWPSGPTPATAKEMVGAVIDVLRDPDAAATRKPDVAFSPDNRIYNTVVAIGFTDCNIAAALRGEVIGVLNQLQRRLAAAANAPRTLKKLNAVLARLKTCPA
jgi:hypothetical protein